ncbi:unnamed protein product [Protopolystoma xenopodis]|uniref:Uncharacterized protein n=1 Tax=Protopolystoma xenopodis TaxID=117903 RepID=A0A448XBQ7_9PLAT|nr:unnamed protein product [Protopolystoma xenopodis]
MGSRNQESYDSGLYSTEHSSRQDHLYVLPTSSRLAKYTNRRHCASTSSVLSHSNAFPPSHCHSITNSAVADFMLSPGMLHPSPNIAITDEPAPATSLDGLNKQVYLQTSSSSSPPTRDVHLVASHKLVGSIGNSNTSIVSVPSRFRHFFMESFITARATAGGGSGLRGISDGRARTKSEQQSVHRRQLQITDHMDCSRSDSRKVSQGEGSVPESTSHGDESSSDVCAGAVCAHTTDLPPHAHTISAGSLSPAAAISLLTPLAVTTNFSGPSSTQLSPSVNLAAVGGLDPGSGAGGGAEPSSSAQATSGRTAATHISGGGGGKRHLWYSVTSVAHPSARVAGDPGAPGTQSSGLSTPSSSRAVVVSKPNVLATVLPFLEAGGGVCGNFTFALDQSLKKRHKIAHSMMGRFFSARGSGSSGNTSRGPRSDDSDHGSLPDPSKLPKEEPRSSLEFTHTRLKNHRSKLVSLDFQPE